MLLCPSEIINVVVPCMNSDHGRERRHRRRHGIFLDMSLIENTKGCHSAKNAGTKPSYSQDKAVKLFVRRLAMEEALAQCKAKKKNADTASKAAKEQVEIMMGLCVDCGDDNDSIIDVLGDPSLSKFMNTIT
jgi:hypothetical protein